MKLNENLEAAGFVHVSREEILAKQLPIAGEAVSPTPGGRSLYQEMQFQYTPEEGLVEILPCPVCNGPAREIPEPGGRDGQIIECRVCGVYDITGTALAMLLARSQEERKEALFKAQQFVEEGQRPSIDSRHVP